MLVLSFSPFSHDVSVPLSKRFSRSHIRPVLSRLFVPRPDLSLTDSTPPFNLHINPTRRNWRVFKRADLEFFRRCRDAAVPRSIEHRGILAPMSMIENQIEFFSRNC